MAWTLDTTISLTTLERAKQQVHIPGAETSQDDVLTRFINEASQRLENMTARQLKSRAVTEYHDGRANNRLLTNQWPIISVAELWDDCSGEFTDSSAQIDSGNFNIDDGTGIVLKKGCYFNQGTRNIKIVYDAGYAAIPADLEGACLWMVEFLYDMRSDERVGTATKSKNSENVTFLQDVPAFVQDTIDKYRRFEFPLATVAVRNL